MKLQQIKELIEIIEKSGVAELNVTEQGEAIHIERLHAHQPPPPSTTAKTVGATTNEPGVGDIDGAWSANARSGDHVVRSPMVGTFYRAPGPGAEPFVEVGDTINDGDVVGIISALQINNQIAVQTRGWIRALLVEDAQPVEYDQPLFVLCHHRDTH